MTKQELESLETPFEIIEACAKALNLPVKVAASWIEGPNWEGYSEQDLKRGDEAAREFLGDEIFEQLDPTGADIPWAVMEKLGLL